MILDVRLGKDWITVMLLANSTRDFKPSKPLAIYHSANPLALKRIVKSSLGVYYKPQKRQLTYAVKCLSNLGDIENYYKTRNLAFKALIIIDKAPGIYR